MNKNMVKNIIIVLIIILLLFGLYFLLKYFTKPSKKEPDIYLKDYKANEYIPSYISDESMASIYLNDYVYKMLYETEDAYYLLNAEYREKKFGSYENYFNYVINLNNYDIIMSKFYKTNESGYTLFGVYDKDNNLYIFKTNGVMQYEVFLDNYTVEIG